MDVRGKLRLFTAPVSPLDVVRKMDLVTGGGINYSTIARDTGLKWVDQSPVYQVVFMGYTGTGLGSNNAVGQLANFIGLVSVTGYVIGSDGWRYPLGYSAGTHYVSARIDEDGHVIETHNPDFLSNARLIMIVQYITITDEITVWDAAGGGTQWDGGATVWDA